MSRNERKSGMYTLPMVAFMPMFGVIFANARKSAEQRSAEVAPEATFQGSAMDMLTNHPLEFWLIIGTIAVLAVALLVMMVKMVRIYA